MVVTGLPVAYLVSDQERLKEIISNFLVAKGADREKVEVLVLPQPLGTFLQVSYDDRLSPIDPDLIHGKTGVVDVGFYTTDFISMKDGAPVFKDMGSIEHGVHSLLSAAALDIERTFDFRLDVYSTEEAIRRGSVRKHGKEIDITSMARKHKKNLADKILGHARTLWGNAGELEKIFFTGGGSAMLGDIVCDHFPNAMLVSNSDMANAGGFYRMATAMARQKGW